MKMFQSLLVYGRGKYTKKTKTRTYLEITLYLTIVHLVSVCIKNKYGEVMSKWHFISEGLLKKKKINPLLTKRT